MCMYAFLPAFQTCLYVCLHPLLTCLVACPLQYASPNSASGTLSHNTLHIPTVTMSHVFIILWMYYVALRKTIISSSVRARACIRYLCSLECLRMTSWVHVQLFACISRCLPTDLCAYPLYCINPSIYIHSDLI